MSERSSFAVGILSWVRYANALEAEIALKTDYIKRLEGEQEENAALKREAEERQSFINEMGWEVEAWGKFTNGFLIDKYRTLKRANERNMSVVWNAISPYIASEDVVYGEGPMTDLCETVLTKMWDALLAPEEQEVSA